MYHSMAINLNDESKIILKISGRGSFWATIPALAWRNWGKPRKASVRIAEQSFELGDPPNTMHDAAHPKETSGHKQNASDLFTVITAYPVR